MRNGGILIIADIDVNYARGRDQGLADLCGFGFSYGEPENRYPIYFVDPARSEDPSWRRIRIDVSSMGVRPWLKPVYEGITELLVDAPVEIRPYLAAPLAHIVSRTAGSLCEDRWWSAPLEGFDLHRLIYHPDGPQGPSYLGPFACVRQLGLGFVVAITGLISGDSLVSRCPGNAKWIVNLISQLQTVSRDDAAKSRFQLFRDVCVFLSHRSADKPKVQETAEALKRCGPRVWLDKERIPPSDSLGLSLNEGLSESSHFALFWSRNCIDAPWVELELNAAISVRVNEKKPIFVISLDNTPLPALLSPLVRIQGTLPAEKIAESLAETILALRRRI